MLNITNKKCFICIDLRTGCFIIAYILMSIHISLALWVIYMTKTIPLEISLDDPKAMVKLTNLMMMGEFLFPLAITMIKFTSFLFIGLKRKSRLFLNVYLRFAKYFLLAFTVASIGSHVYYFMEPCANAAVLSIPIQAVFHYTVRSYYNTLQPTPAKLQHNV